MGKSWGGEGHAPPGITPLTSNASHVPRPLLEGKGQQQQTSSTLLQWSALLK